MSDLTRLLNKIESAHFEHKTSTASPERVAQTVCAFLNTGGGTVLIEVGDNRHAAIQLKSEIEAFLFQHVHPAALWSIELEEAGDAQFCVLDVPAGRDRPYTVENKIFVRHGAQTKVAEPRELQGLVESSFVDSERWERKRMPGAGVERLDAKLIRETAEQAQSRRSYQFKDAKSLPKILSELSLYRQGSITQAAEVLFGVRPAVQFPQIRARVTVYETDKGGNFLDNRQFDSAAVSMLEDVFTMIRKHTPISSTFESGLQRKDQPAFPEAAIREGLVNAFVHRDYANFNGGLAVDIYPGRLVIWNSGSLPEGLKIGDLKREHPSMPNNPDIAQVFFLRGYMERIGRGTQKILTACAEASLPVPKWTVNDTGVTLTFYGKSSAATRLNRRERKLLDEMLNGQTIRLPEYCDRLAVSERQARRDLGDLVASGWMEREGDGPATLFRRTEKPWHALQSGQIRPK